MRILAMALACETMISNEVQLTSSQSMENEFQSATTSSNGF